jgi:hypothetical protein
MGMAVTTPMFVEEEQSYDVDQKSQRPHYDQQLRIVYGFALDEPLASFHCYGKAKSYEEDGVDEGAENFGSGPTERVLRPFFRRHLRGSFSLFELPERSVMFLP